MIVIPERNTCTVRLIDVASDSGAVFQAAVQTATGVVVPFSISVKSPVGFVAASATGTLPAGRLLGCAGIMDGGSGIAGRAAMRVDLSVGGGGGAVLGGCLLRSFFHGGRCFGLPGVRPLVGPLTDEVPYGVPVANPAAGAPAVLTCGSWGFVDLMSVSFRLVADATVATRTAYVERQTGTSKLGRALSNYAHAAGVTIDYFFAQSVIRDGPSSTFREELLSRGGMSGGDVLRVGALNLQATDQLSLISVQGSLWFEL